MPLKTELDIPRFEHLCRRSGLYPVARARHVVGDVYIAEGVVDADMENNVPAHWCVIWAVHHAGVDIAERFPMALESTQRERMLEAVRRSGEYLNHYHATNSPVVLH